MADERWQELRRLLEEVTSPYLGRVAYGNLRMEVYDSDAGSDGAESARIALAYEIPGGSTNQYIVSYEADEFNMLDAAADEVLRLADPGQVAERVGAQIAGIPDYRMARLRDDLDQRLADGQTRLQVLEELNRLLRMGTEFRGGSLTVDELTDACRYVVQRTTPS